MSEPMRYESVPKQGDLMSMSASACAAGSWAMLKAAGESHWRGQGDTWTAARDRAAQEAGVTPAQAERLQKNWRTMKFPNGDVYRLLRNKYGHLCSWVEAKADAMESARLGRTSGNEAFTGTVPTGAGSVAQMGETKGAGQ